jgi:DNA modification methylase
LIKLLTKEDALVLDPFLGSGTTALAAKHLNRNYIGIEIYSEYAEYAQRRLEEENQEIKNREFEFIL